MSEKYIPLYRKYRPKNLQEVVGQEHIKKALTNAINLNKISHAYLFTGPRGTGKTSAARIMAKSLNCQQGPTITPCEVCPSCIDIKNSTPMDVIEIDAASNRSVEDARNILEKIQYVPVNGKYKIYIIDEVHMLTPQAFNALLKTLEEPPENVIFILATTEPQKVLETITSRCQRFDFRRITTDDIINHLKNIAKLEKIKIEDDALSTIAKNAAGGMRDSLALLDQVSVLDGSKTITTEDVNTLLGRLSFEVLNTLSENIIQSKPQEAIQDLVKIYNSGNEPTQILTNLLGYFKNLLIVRNCEEKSLLTDLTQLNEGQIKVLQSQAKNIDTHQIVFLIEKIAYYIKELKTTNNQHLWLEIAMIDLANLSNNTSLLSLQDRISKLEQGGTPAVSSQAYITPPSPVVKMPIKPPVEAPKAEPVKTLVEQSKPIIEEIQDIEEVAVKEAPAQAEEEFSPIPKTPTTQTSGNNIMSLWKSLLMNIESPSARALLSGLAKPIEISPENLIITFDKEMFVKQANDESKRLPLIQAAETLFNTTGIKLTVRLSSPTDKPIAPQVEPEKKNSIIKQSPTENTESPDDYVEELEIISKSKTKTPEKKEATFMPSDQVSMVMNLFDGKYID